MLIWRLFCGAGSVGLYVPGGTAVLPSSTLMMAVPAQIAGCKTIVMATPPRPDGQVHPLHSSLHSLSRVSISREPESLSEFMRACCVCHLCSTCRAAVIDWEHSNPENCTM